MGVDIGKTNILVHAAAMIGRKYAYGQTGKITLEKQVTDMRFQTLLVMAVKITVFWDVTLCNLESEYQHFRRRSCLHLQVRRIYTEEGSKQFLKNDGTCLLNYTMSHLRRWYSLLYVLFNFIKIFLY
jgi:hypothetical protein